MYTPTGRAIGAFLRPLSALLLSLPVKAATPSISGAAVLGQAPIIGSLSARAITFAEVQQGFFLSVNGGQFVSSSVVDHRRVVQFLECHSGDILVRVAAS
jgi:hypothetical protein